MSSSLRGATAALLLLVSPVAMADPPAPASAPAGTAAKPDVATLLFSTPMWAKAPAGSKIRYTYEKTTAEAALGNSFKDEIVLTTDAGDEPQSRTVEMQLFSGANRKPAGPFRSDQQNPVLLVVLEENVQELSKLFKANPRYLKNAIRKAWREHATIESGQANVDGKQVPVTRISVSPFVGDAEADLMKGLQTLTYVVETSPDVPGDIVTIDIRAKAQDKTLFAETLHYVSETKP